MNLGVRVVKRAADLTITAVNDYLEGALAELNRQHLSDATPWVLVQPSGIFPLVGPCSARAKPERLLGLPCRANGTQPGNQGISRPQACSPGLTSPLAQDMFGQSAIQLAASRSQKRSLPIFVRTCAITSSASTCWARPLRGTMFRPAAMSGMRPYGAARPPPRADAG